MRIVYFGNGPRGVRCLEALRTAGEQIAAVVGHPGPATDVVSWAIAHGLPTLQPDRINDPSTVEALRALGADLFVLSGYSRILKPAVFELPPAGCINLHGGKLPEYRGCAPINWQIINGETVGGCCILYVDAGIDTGDILAQVRYEIGPDDTAADVVDRQLALFPRLLLDVIAQIKNGTARALPQDRSAGCQYLRRHPEDGLVDWSALTARQVHDLVRALFDPYPNAFTYLGARKVRLRRTRLIRPPIRGVPGRVVLGREEGMVVCCRDEALLVVEVGLDDDGAPASPRGVLQRGDRLRAAPEGGVR